jgi:cytochrome c551/c552/sugar phosphate isomerase/epimerase
MIRTITFLLWMLLPLRLTLAADVPDNFRRENVAAWCIVPFDALQRTPAERAAMLKEIGMRRCAYDWRAKHVAEFEEEIRQYKKHGIEMFAFWGAHDKAFELFKSYSMKPQIWQMMAQPKGPSQAEKVAQAVQSVEGLAKRTDGLGLKLALYNHGGWSGEPENLAAVCRELRGRGYSNVGIVYNWHHAHQHIEDWAASLATLKPYLFCLNLNGMNSGARPKILPIGQGQQDRGMLKALFDSGYDGPIGVLDHQSQLDSKEALLDNLYGLEWLSREVATPGSGGPPPEPLAKPVVKAKRPAAAPTAAQTASLSAAFGKALAGGVLIAGRDAWRQPPITVECRIRLNSAADYNILVASDSKASSAHWEIFTFRGSGKLAVYLPGATPDHVRSDRIVTDGKWHAVAMQYGADRVRLWLDGAVVADQRIVRDGKPAGVVPGELGIGRLVSGALGMDGAIDELRIRQGLHDDISVVADTPFSGGKVLGYWDFERVPEAASPAATDPTPTPGMPFGREPLDAAANPYWRAFVNRDRIYDFYAKQAIHYGALPTGRQPRVLPEFPGLDGGKPGHWGNQNDKTTWKDGRVRTMDHGSMISGVFRGSKRTFARAVTVQLTDGYNAVFNADSQRFELAWTGALVEWSDVRRGLMNGIPMGQGKAADLTGAAAPLADSSYVGLYRDGRRVVFASEENGVLRFREAVVDGGRVVERLVDKPAPGPAQWSQRVITKGVVGRGQPYAMDTLTLPYTNPWKSLMFVSGIDFLSAGRLAICTMHGDVWICDVRKNDLSELVWKRFAAGLHQPLGLKVNDGVVHVICRDQIVALHDLNGDDEADFYSCVSNAHKTSAGGHDFITGLQRDDKGRWYFASGNQGVCRVSADGRDVEVLSSGFRNPNGLAIAPDGSVVLTSVQEGNWTPASAVCEVQGGGHFGAGGPKPGRRGNVAPLCYLPRGVDNSSGGQVYIGSDRWGPVSGQWVHFSSGFASAFLVLREVVNEQAQAAVVPLPGAFLSGAHRGRFSPFDGQLYVAGAQGWGNYGMMDGAVQRLRYTGGDYRYPIKFETRFNGIMLTFADAQALEIGDAGKWFVQQWNYKYGPAYGSPEFSVTSPATRGHDRVDVRSVHRLADGRKLFIEIPQLRPVHQLHLHFTGERPLQLFATVHNLAEPFTTFPGYRAAVKDVIGATVVSDANTMDPKALVAACTACHHPTTRVVGPPFSDIIKLYANNPDGIVKWAMNPQIRNKDLPPMPSFAHLGEKRLKIVADYILKEYGK